MHNKKLLLTLILVSTAILGSSQVVIISTNSNWKYKDDGSNQGTSWYGTSFNDASWSSGPAELGYGDSDEATIVNACGTTTPLPSCSNKFITTYFRQTFTVANPSAFTSYSVQMRRDDGVVLYLNGVEIYRDNMPAGTISYTTTASSACADDGALVINPTIPSSLIVTGSNVIAAEIHQNSGTTPDLSFVFTLYGNPSSASSQFTGNNIVALVAGNGNSALSGSATPFFLKEFSSNGDMLYSYTVPVSSNSLTMSGSATSEGGLTLSEDNTKLIIVGYNAPVGTSTIANTSASSVNRVVAAVNATGGITYTSSTGYFSTNNIRCGASDGAGNFWTGGGSSGACYMGSVSAAGIVESAITSIRYLQIFNNNLYFTTSSSAGIYKIGSGLPVTASQTNSMIINTSTVGTGASPYAFFFNPQMSICYIADDRSLVNGGGIQKWVNSAGTWTLAYTFSTSIAMSTSGARGVIADFSGTYPIVYGTSAETNTNRLFRIIDGGSVSGSTITTLATASTNTIFRGLAFSPTISTCSGVSIVSVTPGATVCNSQSVNLNVSVSGSSPITYTWSGPGTLSSYSLNNSILTTPVAGEYTIKVSNSCGTSSAVISVSINAGPTISINSTTICAGEQATISVSGASTYTWNGGSNSTSISVSPTVSTFYDVMGSDAMGCISSSTTQVIVNPLPTVAVNSATACMGTSVILTADGATTYTWSSGSTDDSVTITATANAIYTVTGTSSLGCINTATSQITADPQPTISINSETICSGSAATLNASGASTYTWSNTTNSNSITINPSATTVYSVIGSMPNGCEASSTATVTVTPTPDLSVTNATICEGDTAILSASGATSYSWSTNDASYSISVSPSATTSYSVTGTTSGCSSTATVEVDVNLPPSISVNAVSICSGGSATLIASGAFTYTWNNSANDSIVVVSPTVNSTYTVYGTSFQGCSDSVVTTVSLTGSPGINVNPVSVCAGNTVMITAGGVTTYTWETNDNTASIVVSPTATTIYSISGNASGCSAVASNTVKVTVQPLPVLSANSSTICAGESATISVLGAASYTWNNNANSSDIVVSPSVTTLYSVNGVDSLGCLGTASAQVSVNTNPTLNINSITICSGETATLTVTGANTYTWSNSSNNLSIGVTPAISTAYSVTGTNSFGCSDDATVQVVVNSNPTLNVLSSTICSGETATLTVTGAATYTWSNTSNSSSIVVSPDLTTVYSVTGTSSLGCTGNATTNIIVNETPSLSVNNVTICSGASATLTASGAFTYSWNTGATTFSTSVNPIVTTVYNVTGFNSECSSSKTVQVVVDSLPSISVNSVSVCRGGSATLTANGATSYTWSNLDNSPSMVITPTTNLTYTVSGSSARGCTSSAVANVSVTASPSITVNPATVCAGNSTVLNAAGVSTYTWNTTAHSSSIAVNPSGNTVYTVSGNVSGCSVIASNTVLVIVNPLPVLNVNSASICSGHAATLSATGASNYTWSSGGTNSSIVVSPIASSVYTISGIDSSFCSSNATVQITVHPNPTISVNAATVCAGTVAVLSASGAATYSWNTGATVNSLSLSPGATTIYTVTGTTSGCSDSRTTTLTVNPVPTLTANPVSICAGGTVGLNAGGAFTYTWSNSSTGSSIVVTPTANTDFTVTGTSTAGCSNSVITTVSVTNIPSITVNSATICAGNTATLIAGGISTYTWSNNSNSTSIAVSPTSSATYTVVGNESGCPLTVSNTVYVTVNAIPTVGASSASLCIGTSADIMASGASTYSWSNNATTSSINISPTITTIYTVTGISAQGCIGTATSQVTVTPNPTITIGSLSICAGNNATLTASGASTYSWNTGSFSPVLIVTPSVTTIYNVIGTLAGCTGLGSATITVNPSPTLSINSLTICRGTSDTLHVSGASSYSWNNIPGNTSMVVSPTVNTIYSVTGISALGCSSSATTQVTVTSPPQLSVTSASICAGDSTTLFVSGATTYTWTGGINSVSLSVSPSTTTTYPVSGNLAGCLITATTLASVSVNALPILNVNSATVCEGNSATLTVTGADTYSWSNGSIQKITVVNPSTTSSYTVTGTSLQGCISSATPSVVVKQLPVVSLSLSTPVLCVGDGNFKLVGVPSGGTFSGNGVNGNIFEPGSAGIGTTQVVYSYTDSNDCSNSDNKLITINLCTEIKESTEPIIFKVWPNPATNLLFVQLEGMNDWRVEILDLRGEMLIARKAEEESLSLNVKDFDNGVYLIRLISGNHTVTTKTFVKE